MFTKISELWEAFLIRGEELQYQASEERKQLAINRLAVYRKFMDDDPSCISNPYQNPENYDFY